MALNVKIPP